MTIGSIGNSPTGAPPQPPRNQPLTDDQKQQVSDLLAAYDSENLSEEDAKTILETLKEAGIRPGKDLESAFSDAGFDLRSVADTAGLKPPQGGPQGGKPPAPPAEGEETSLNTEGLQTLQDILDSYDLENLSDEDEATIIKALADAGLTGVAGDLFSTKA
ncbi:hypothetical protein [Gimibacter soli]|uniref:Uncharacterized protein n=1 Tax=Gimibacter soli TaxID=3024400 RepID=A0AAF0BL31_9PROT|nr:hypothetical protein [Gimibacter soli]WCL54974.1 hypothetical protein PH603_04275 [Gimibacter soli]